MSSIFDKLLSQNLLNTPPSFLKNNIHYEVLTGSVAYGCNSVNKSDKDIYGFAIPPKDLIFPHTAGYIIGFDKNIPVFNQYQQHHIVDSNNKEYDITIYGIVQFFKLCAENNPNMIDALFVPRRCVLFTTQIGEYVRDNRQYFLHKGSFYKFRGYAKSQLHKMQNKAILKFIDLCKKHDIDYHVTIDDIRNNSRLDHDTVNIFVSLINQIDKNGKRTKRIDDIAKYGYDVKFAYHLIRLFMECEQILTEHSIELDRDKEFYKSIRRGDWKKENVIDFFEINENRLQKIYDKSTLKDRPDNVKIKQILIDCLEMHYGNLEKCVSQLNNHELAIRDIKKILFDRKL